MYMKKSAAFILAMVFALMMLSGCNEKKSEPSSPESPDTPVTPDPPEYDIIDICDNKYKQVQIGDQVWMTENMRCEKYDTQSGMEGATITKYTSKNPGGSTYAPYCVDASEKELWDSDKYAKSLSSKQVEKLGYLYSWAAAVGFETENAAKDQATPFEENRQGICPNGWHVPTDAELETLANYIESNATAGKKLKTTSGWYNDGNGTDDYSFAALPSGLAGGSTMSGVGYSATFWTATPSGKGSARGRYLSYNFNSLTSTNYSKDFAFSVRCIKN